jgi:GTPase SAR1 family protein
MANSDKTISHRLSNLKTHLKQENPLLVEVVGHFEQLDKIGYKAGFLDKDESFANRISWWPLVSILGTFSAGKSTFINSFLGGKLQKTGNQAVDDKFTVLTFSSDDEVRVLPGLALDADPRFPFYQIGEELEKVSPGEGSKVDSYLQLKTCHSDRLKGKILIDSPGFDADEQRNAILRITDHIIDLSDLVLVFFDARHPEPGAMKDTLQHLVRNTLDRTDATKFIFVLNQIDTTAREDNLEEVVAAWQKAVVQAGLTAGTFYCLFDADAAISIEDAAVMERYQRRRDADLAAITERIAKVGVERSYRIVGTLEATADKIEHHWMPEITSAVSRWRKRVLITDAVLLTLIGVGLFTSGFLGAAFNTLGFNSLADSLGMVPVLLAGGMLLLFVATIWLHFLFRKWHAKIISAGLKRKKKDASVIKAFNKNTHFTHSLFRTRPLGWGGGARRKLNKIREAADSFVQTLNDRFTDPSGGAG